MKLSHLTIVAIFLALSSGAVAAQAGANEKWKATDAAMGRSGQDQPDGTHKYSMPRSDLSVSVAGTQIKPGLALGSWAAFKNTGNQAVVMGDLVLKEDEVQPVIEKLQAGGIEITALHNHLLQESPRVMYMHIGGKGQAVNLAKAIHDALAETKTPGPSQSPSQPPKLDIDTAQIDKILGHSGKNNGGIYQVSVPRAERITEAGVGIPNSMGVATGINFQPTGGGNAAIAGDFVLIGKEVNPVIKALESNGIAVLAVHSHMLDEQPRLFFLHFWANDDAVKLAKGLRAALDQMNTKK